VQTGQYLNWRIILSSSDGKDVITLDAIQAGLTQGEFFLEYLPTVSLADNRCVGAEALARWRRPSGVVTPDVFIPLIEQTPLSGLLTYWVIETVAKELKRYYVRMNERRKESDRARR